MHTMILVSFPSGGYVDEPVDNQKFDKDTNMFISFGITP